MILLNQSLLFLNVCTELCSGFYDKDRFLHRWADRKKQFLKYSRLTQQVLQVELGVHRVGRVSFLAIRPAVPLAAGVPVFPLLRSGAKRVAVPAVHPRQVRGPRVEDRLDDHADAHLLLPAILPTPDHLFLHGHPGLELPDQVHRKRALRIHQASLHLPDDPDDHRLRISARTYAALTQAAPKPSTFT
jgi:hypothetical protein